MVDAGGIEEMTEYFISNNTAKILKAEKGVLYYCWVSAIPTTFLDKDIPWCKSMVSRVDRDYLEHLGFKYVSSLDKLWEIIYSGRMLKELSR